MKKWLTAAAVLIAALGIYFWQREAPQAPTPIAAQETLRSTQLGNIVGYVAANGAHAWLGIPFAQPPVGALRWMAPRSALPWQGTLEALRAGSMCVQLPSLLSGAGQSPDSSTPVGNEDCLFLNVFAPADADGPTLPVMVWIHGGGNSIGHGGSYDGAHLAAAHNLIVVTINYRLGPFGWFNHPALDDDGATIGDGSGNYGTLDTIAALEWVQDHIGTFGGDPNRVTIFGESAGGTDVLALMASPLARGLFDGAIVQSGGLWLASSGHAANYIDDAEPGHEFSAKEVVNHLLVRDGRATDLAAARSLQDSMTGEAIRDYLMDTSANDIMAVFSGGGFGMIDFPGLIADGDVLPAESDPKVIFADATAYNPVPVILGTNRDEAALFMARNPRWTENFLWIFPRLKDPVAYKRHVGYQSRAWKARGVDELAMRLHAAQGTGVFAYRFDWDEEESVMGFDLATALGAAHGLEIPFVFGDFEGGLGLAYLYPDNPARDALSASMMSYWAAFAHRGDPGTGIDGTEVAWLPWGRDGQRMIVLDTEDDGGIRMSAEAVTFDTVRAELIADPTFTEPTDKCELYALLFRDALFRADEYEALGCGDLDPASFRRF